MGPRLDSRGNLAAGSKYTAITGLQWGRDLIVAETIVDHVGTWAAGQLQWGRDLIVAETRLDVSGSASVFAGFNGAAT